MITVNTWVFVTLYFLFGIVSYLLGAAVEKFIISGKTGIKADDDIEYKYDIREILPYISDDITDTVCMEEDGSLVFKNKEGTMIKLDEYGVALYNPESGTWTSLN